VHARALTDTMTEELQMLVISHVQEEKKRLLSIMGKVNYLVSKVITEIAIMGAGADEIKRSRLK
jgi:hypothetical protein